MLTIVLANSKEFRISDYRTKIDTDVCHSSSLLGAVFFKVLNVYFVSCNS